jgi:hypothetical protein
VYQEDGRDPLELASWKGNIGAFSYRDHSGDWSSRWPIDDKVSQTPWLVRVETGSPELSTLVASVAGVHRRTLRLQDTPAGLPGDQP